MVCPKKTSVRVGFSGLSFCVKLLSGISATKIFFGKINICHKFSKLIFKMVLTAPYFSIHWFDRSVNDYLVQYHRLCRFLESYPRKNEEEFKLFSQVAFGVVTLQKTLMWLKYLQENYVFVLPDIMNLVYEEFQLRVQLRTAQIRLEVGKEVCILIFYLFYVFYL